MRSVAQILTPTIKYICPVMPDNCSRIKLPETEELSYGLAIKFFSILRIIKIEMLLLTIDIWFTF